MRIQLRSKVRDADKRGATGATEEDIAVELRDDCDVYKPNGEILCALRREALSEGASMVAYPALHHLRKYVTDNRATYTGLHTSGVGAPKNPEGGGVYAAKRKDGKASRQTRALGEDGKVMHVASAIVGYYDRMSGRFPFCRTTAFTANEVEKWETIVPLVREAGRLFEHEFPDRFAKQMAMVEKTPPEYVIEGTPFTTLTVNNNVVASIHKDVGDYKDGIGMISVAKRGDYEGGYLVFPEYRCGVKLGDRDVLFFNSHDWHGVTRMFVNGEPIEHLPKDERPERISVVYYFRTKMTECLPRDQELALAKERGAL